MADAPRLLGRVHEALRVRQYSYRTEQQYVAWIRRFILFHGKRRPETMGAPEVEAFLPHLATERNVSASTQGQALAALRFLYRAVLGVQLPWLDNVVRARRPKNLPVILTRDEVRRVLTRLLGTPWLVASLLYGSDMRLGEALNLRLKDIGLDRLQLVVRNGKGAKDRVTVLPNRLVSPLRAQLAQVIQWHRQACHAGHGGVELPYGLALKYPRAHLEPAWQYVFPAPRPSCHPRTGTDCWATQALRPRRSTRTC